MASMPKPTTAERADEARPETVIEPHRGFNPINWRELWAFRELMYFLTWRDVKVRYKQTVLGAAWAIFQPVMGMIVFTIFFGKLAKMPSENMPYPVFVYAGILPWTFFANCVTSASVSLIRDSHLVGKIYFPRLVIPISSLGARLMDFGVSFLFVFVLMAYYGIFPGISALMLPFLFMSTVFAALGVGTFLSALNVAYRDVGYITPFMVQLWMYATPVVYPVSIVPEKWRWALSLNPMAGLIDGYRSALFGKPLDELTLGISSIVSLVTLAAGLFYFKKVERRFADII